jgi:membrane-associated phospholipid phosphatase
MGPLAEQGVAPFSPATPQSIAISRLDAGIWWLIAASAAPVALAIAIGGFEPAWPSFAGPGFALMVLIPGAWCYRNIRNDQRLASALMGTAQVVAFSAIGAPLSYVATALAWSFPLQDQFLDLADKALGLDWRAVLAWMNANSEWHPIFRMAYGSITLQASVAILALAFTGRLVWLRVFVLAFIIAALIAIATAAVIPAYGVWGYYGLTPQDHPHIAPVVRDLPVPIIDGLRDGSFRLLLAIGAEGIITFPSLHAAFAIILAAAFWPVPVLRWFGLVLNAVMLASTPVDGAHYFVDIFAGLVVAAVSIALARAVTARSLAASAATTNARPAALPSRPRDGIRPRSR